MLGEVRGVKGARASRPGRLASVACALLTSWAPGGAVPAAAQMPIARWSAAGPYPAAQVNRSAYPGFYGIFAAAWQEAEANARGVVELSPRFPGEAPAGGKLAIARRVFRSNRDRTLELELGWAGDVDVFFNRRPVFSGHESACATDAAALALPACATRLALPVRSGLNEIFLMVGSGEAGWAFRASATEALPDKLTRHGDVEEVWATPDTFLTSESVLKDPARDLLYVTSFDNQYATRSAPSGYISTLSLDGRILEHRWLDGLNAPTGMDIRRDTLWICERKDLLAIEIASRRIVGRWPIPDVVFPNDLVVDDDGAVYVSDTRTGNWPASRIYRFKDGSFEIFADEGIDGANGLWIRDGALLVGNSGDGMLKRVDLKTRRVEDVVSLGSGIVDGIRVDEDGNLLVSFWEGQLFRIGPQGDVVELLDALPAHWNTADFEYLPEQRLLVIPTFTENRVRALRIRR
ncbi:MAG: SMP-30/gluconolactonase/LRE family protein [Gemmatimonadetes bacterium]|nr:SMP-30/gluconolactonase/LRE family protein [Gemmatimonadota bacterium]